MSWTLQPRREAAVIPRPYDTAKPPMAKGRGQTQDRCGGAGTGSRAGTERPPSGPATALQVGDGLGARMVAAMRADYDLSAHLTRFCRALRSHGLLVGPPETADAIRTLGLVDVMDRMRVYWSLRCVLLSRREETGTFDALFDRFWDFEPLPERPRTGSSPAAAGGAKELRPRPRSLLLPEHDAASENTLVQLLRTGASSREVRSPTDLTVIRAEEQSDVSRIASRIVRALASRPGRRRKRNPRKGTPDLRGALRLSIATGGDVVRLPRLRRLPRVPRLLVLLDVSGSMDRHVQLMLQLIYAVSQHTKRVETFAFSTSATRVTRELQAPSFGEAMGRVGRVVDHWSGGTRIGESLAAIGSSHPELQDRQTTVFLLSDGWETGDPEHLGRQVREMRRRVRRLVWLNPLLGTMGYEPLSRGMRSVAPHVDHFVPARAVSHLRRLPPLLRA